MQFGIVVLQAFQDKHSGDIGYHSYILSKCGEMVERSQRTVECLHSKSATYAEAKLYRRQLLRAIRQMILRWSSQRAKVCFSTIVTEYDVARKEKTTLSQLLTEWDALGKENRRKGLCTLDCSEDLLFDKQQRKRYRKSSRASPK